MTDPSDGSPAAKLCLPKLCLPKLCCKVPPANNCSFVQIQFVASSTSPLWRWSLARVLSDIVKRRSIRVPCVTDVTSGAPSPDISCVEYFR